MDKIYHIKEDQKNNQTEPNYKKKSNSIDKSSFRNKIEYSKKIQKRHNKHLINIHKLFLKEKNSMSQTKSQFPLYNLNVSKNKSIRFKDTSSYVYTPTHRDELIEKEKIISEIFRIQDEINIKDEELNEYKNSYKQLKDSNLTFKAIIERLLNIEEDADINEKNDQTDNNKVKNKNKNKLDLKKIKRLKLEILNVDKNIEEKEKILDETKNKKNINSFININKLLNEKNRELENLISGSQKLQYSQHEMEKKIDFYFSSIKFFTETYNKLQDKLKINEKELKNINDEIEYNKKELNDYNNKIEKLEEEIKIIEKNKIKKKEEINKINEEYNSQKQIEKEKEKIDNDLDNIYNKINNIKKVIEKNNRNIDRIKYENTELENEISILKVESNTLNEKAKHNQKYKQNLKYYEKEKILLKEEIKKNKLKYQNILNKEEEDKEKIRKEIEEFEKAKKALINKINELTEELKEKNKENNIKEEELVKANEEYSNVIKDNKSNN